VSKQKQAIREAFRNAVFKRDGYRCRVCGRPEKLDGPLDAHHITDRNEMPNGGYVKENGISLCAKCHREAERFHITKGTESVPGYHPDDLYKLIGSSKEKAHAASIKL
jgi:5-methylcytosine-specific restriction endonuclease McrA